MDLDKLFVYALLISPILIGEWMCYMAKYGPEDWPFDNRGYVAGEARRWRLEKDGYIPEPDPLAPVDGDEYLRILHKGRMVDSRHDEEIHIIEIEEE